MPKSRKFALYLKQSREKSGLTQLEVSQILGYSTPQFVSNWERGRSYPPIKTLKTISKLYKINPDHLFEKIVEFGIEQTREALLREYKSLRAKPG
jgi:transcriptional regulator with XRE-family HTH domain